MSSDAHGLPHIANLVRRAVLGGEIRVPAAPLLEGSREFLKLSASDVNSILLAMKDLDAVELGVSGRKSVKTGVGNIENTTGLPIGFCFVGCEADIFEASIFVLPPNARIPVHSHPSMYVFTRVLFGTMEVDEYEIEKELSPGLFSATKSTSIAKEGDVRSLAPERGNIHSFRATDWTAVFDIAVPPYDPDGNRPCRYYEPTARGASFSLRETTCPRNYVTTEMEYMGNPLV